jgi:hypothetical protein
LRARAEGQGLKTRAYKAGGQAEDKDLRKGAWEQDLRAS